MRVEELICGVIVTTNNGYKSESVFVMDIYDFKKIGLKGFGMKEKKCVTVCINNVTKIN